jgi:hypothetical protein
MKMNNIKIYSLEKEICNIEYSTDIEFIKLIEIIENNENIIKYLDNSNYYYLIFGNKYFKSYDFEIIHNFLDFNEINIIKEKPEYNQLLKIIKFTIYKIYTQYTIKEYFENFLLLYPDILYNNNIIISLIKCDPNIKQLIKKNEILLF